MSRRKTPVATPPPVHPHEGGSYRRQPDGSLIRAAEAPLAIEEDASMPLSNTPEQEG